MSTVRTRIAPSPSGFLHIGTSKTALYNWLFARKMGGQFILRLEDTDAERTDEKFVQGMCEGFHWLGIEWDEGPQFGDVPEKGNLGPYRQSQRRELHREAALKLLADGKAYKCFCSKEELEPLRAPDGSLRYNAKCRNLTHEQIAAMGDRPYVVRFKVPEGETTIDDLIQGQVRFDNREYDDFVILKPNGDPIFHLAVVVDDITMKITHVIRGDDHLTNAARHVMLFKALEAPLPQFAHHPLVHDEQGRKFSKRLHGANVLDWREDGYLPETIINYVALLGWTSEEENREFFVLDELRQAFSIERIGKSPARFDRKKLDWLNGQHIRRLTAVELRDRLIPILEKNGFDTTTKSPAWLTHMALVCQEKLPTLNHIVALTDFFFQEVAAYEEKGVQKQWNAPTARERMTAVRDAIAALSDWNHDSLKAAFMQLVEFTGHKLGDFINPVRLALTGKTVGPGLFELAELLGKETSIARLDKALQYMANLGGPQS